MSDQQQPVEAPKLEWTGRNARGSEVRILRCPVCRRWSVDWPDAARGLSCFDGHDSADWEVAKVLHGPAATAVWALFQASQLATDGEWQGEIKAQGVPLLAAIDQRIDAALEDLTATRDKRIEELEGKLRDVLTALREEAESYERQRASSKAAEVTDRESGKIGPNDSYIATWNYYEGVARGFEWSARRLAATLDTSEQGRGEEKAYLVRCGECGFLGESGGESGCVKCGYDGGFLPSEAQNDGAIWMRPRMPIDGLEGERRPDVTDLQTRRCSCEACPHPWRDPNCAIHGTTTSQSEEESGS